MSQKPTYPGNTVMVRPDGPFICASDAMVKVQDAEGNLIAEEKELALCRCGGSANKPFCDGSHKRNTFQADQEFIDERGEDIAGQEGEFLVTVKPNAMLFIKGPMTIFSRSGESVTTRSKAALCRCGASENRPFCDASHKGCGFKA